MKEKERKKGKVRINNSSYLLSACGEIDTALALQGPSPLTDEETRKRDLLLLILWPAGCRAGIPPRNPDLGQNISEHMKVTVNKCILTKKYQFNTQLSTKSSFIPMCCSDSLTWDQAMTADPCFLHFWLFHVCVTCLFRYSKYFCKTSVCFLSLTVSMCNLAQHNHHTISLTKVQ